VSGSFRGVIEITPARACDTGHCITGLFSLLGSTLSSGFGGERYAPCAAEFRERADQLTGARAAERVQSIENMGNPLEAPNNFWHLTCILGVGVFLSK